MKKLLCKFQWNRILIILLAFIPMLGFSQASGGKFMGVIDIKDLLLNEKQLATVETIKALPNTKEVYVLQIGKISIEARSNKGALLVKMPGSNNALVASPKNFEYFSDDDFNWYGEFEKDGGDLSITCKDGETFGRISVGAQSF